MHIFFEKSCRAEQELQIAIKQIVNYREEIELVRKQVNRLKDILSDAVHRKLYPGITYLNSLQLSNRVLGIVLHRLILIIVPFESVTAF